VKLKEYREKLNKLAEENPEADDMQVIYSKDDEGNWYQHVNYDPGLGTFKNGEYISTNDAGYNDTPNAVCIN
jgi:hypothetical protein